MVTISCAGCVSGSKHQVTLVGSATKIHGLDCYVSKPSGKPTGLVVIIPDAVGWEFENNREIADKFAEAGFLAYLPDFMQGNAVSADLFPYMDGLQGKDSTWYTKITSLPTAMYHLIPFLLKSSKGNTIPVLETFFKALQDDERKTMKIGTAGYCWGGYYSIFANTDTPERKALADAGYTAHPSFTSVDDCRKVTNPLSITVGTLDSAFPKATQDAVKTVFETERKDHPFEMVVYPDTVHGFAVRYNQHDEKEVKEAKEAQDQAVAWFNKWLK